jgi:protein KRI1
MAFKGLLDRQIDEKIKINTKFAKSFEARKRREEIQKAKKKAEELEIYSGSDGSSIESEDSSAELLTKKADSKFMKLMTMIKKGDPKLKDPEFKAFSDSDFDGSSVSSKQDSNPVTYKKLFTKQILNPVDEPVKNSHIVEQKKIKDEFLNAVNEWDSKNTDDGFLISRDKDRSQNEKTTNDDLEMYADNTQDIKALKDYWSKANDDNELFLKKFVVEKLWEDPKEQLMTYDEIVDEEDAKKTTEVEKFETAYNFRYEEEGFEKLKSIY